MPSFSYDVKSELLNIVNFSKCCNFAQLNGMLKVGAVINEDGNRIDFMSVNAAISRKVLTLIKKTYPRAKTSVAVIRYKKFRASHRYLVRIFVDNYTKPLLTAMQNNKFPKEICCQNTYIRGLFLACGSVNSPESKQYHFEISARSQQIAKFIAKNLRKIDFPVKIYKRNENHIIYLKNHDFICDILYIMNAENAVQRFEVAQNVKEVRANVNRIINCETANLQKAIEAAQRQIKDIKIIYELGLQLDDSLKETAECRLQNPEASMPELAEKLFVSTSLIKQRMIKIHKIADTKGNI